MFNRMAMGVPGGGNVLLGIFGLVFTAALVAATIIAIVMLIDAARERGIEVKGAKLAGFWIVGLVLTPITLGLYVLCLKPREAREQVAALEAVPSEPAPFDPEGAAPTQQIPSDPTVSDGAMA